MSHPTIAGRVFWAICCTKFQVKLSLETATVVRTSSILICNAHPYCLAPFKTKYKRTARVAGRLTHFQASFFVQTNTPPRYTGVHFATAIGHLAKVKPCERPIEHLAKVQKRSRASHRPSRMCRVAQGLFLQLPFGSEHPRQG